MFRRLTYFGSICIVLADMNTNNLDRLNLDILFNRGNAKNLELSGDVRDALALINGKAREALGGLILNKPVMREALALIEKAPLPIVVQRDLYHALLLDVTNGRKNKAGRPRTKPSKEEISLSIEALAVPYEAALREIITEQGEIPGFIPDEVKEAKDIPKKIAKKLMYGVFIKVGGSTEEAEKLMDSMPARKAAITAIRKIFPKFEGAPSFYAHVTKKFRDKINWKALI